MADDFQDTTGMTKLSAPTRNNYFYGKMLDVQHFTLEQQYFNNKRALLNRLGWGSGIMCGLTLGIAGDRLVINPGVAIDPLGREIIVPGAVAIDPRKVTDDSGKPVKTLDSGDVTICLKYHTCLTDMTAVLVADCDTRNNCAPGTIRETFAITVSEGAPTAYEPGCAVEDLFTPANGESRATPAEVYAKLMNLVGGACADVSGDVCVVLGQVTLPAAGEALADTNLQPTGRRVILNNAMLFQLILCLWDRVETCCAGGSPTSEPTSEPTAGPTDAPTDEPTSEPTEPPTAEPTVEPTEEPTGEPTIAPTSEPVTPFNIVAVEFVNLNNKVVAKVEDPNQPVALTRRQQVAGIRVTFNREVEHHTITTADGNTDPIRASFLVRGGASQLPDGVILGTVAPIDAQTTQFTVQSDARVFVPSDYKVVLFGEADRARRRPGITSADGVLLDGESAQLPSGDGTAGGDFVFGFVVS